MQPPRVTLAARTGDSAWSRADVAWQSPAGDGVAVFAGYGPQGLGSSLAHEVARGLSSPPATAASERAAWAVRRAHETALAMREVGQGLHGAIASIAWDGHLLAIAHAGDARVYRLRLVGRELTCLTRDDVAGEHEPWNRLLTNTVGNPDGVTIHEQRVTWDPGHVLVCATPRIWRSLPDVALLDAIETSPVDAAARIVSRCARLDPRAPGAIAIVSW